MSQARPEKKQDASPASPAAIELPPLSFPKDITGSLEFTMEEIKGIIASAINKDPLISKVGQVLAQYPEHLPHVGPTIKVAAGDSKDEEKNTDASVIAEKLERLFERLELPLKEVDRQYIFKIVNELIKLATATLIERFRKPTQDRSTDTVQAVSIVLSSLQRDETDKNLAHNLIKKRIGEPSADNLASACIALADIFFTARAIGAGDRQLIADIEITMLAQGKELKESQGDKKSEKTKETPKSYDYQSLLKQINSLGSKEITDSKISNDLLTIKQLALSIHDVFSKDKCVWEEYIKIFNIFKQVKKMRKLIKVELKANGVNEVLKQQLRSVSIVAFALQGTLVRFSMTQGFDLKQEDLFSEQETKQVGLDAREDVPLADDDAIMTPEAQLDRQLHEIQRQFDAKNVTKVSESVANMMRIISYIPGQKISVKYFSYLFHALSLEIAVQRSIIGFLPSSALNVMNNVLQLILDGSPTVLQECFKPGDLLLSLFDNILTILLQAYFVNKTSYEMHVKGNYLQARAALEGAMQCMWYFERGLVFVLRSRNEIQSNSAFSLWVSKVFPEFLVNTGDSQDLCAYAYEEFQKLEEAMLGLAQTAQAKYQAATWSSLEDAMAKKDAFEMQQQADLKDLEAKVIARMQELEAEKKAEKNFQGFVKQADQKDASAKRKAEEKVAKERQLQEQKDEAARIKGEQQEERKKQQELKSGDGKLIQQEAKTKAVYDPQSAQGKLYDEAGQLLRQNEYSQAESCYKQAIKAANEASRIDHVIIVCSYVELADCKLREADNYLRIIKEMILTGNEDASATIERISAAYLAASLLVQRAINHCGDHLAIDSHVSPEQLQQIEASTRFIRGKLENNATVKYEPVLISEVLEEDQPLEQHQFCLMLEKPKEEKECAPALFYRVKSPYGEVVNSVIENAELKQCLGSKYQDFLNAVASQNQSELRLFLNRDLIRITSEKGHTFKGFLSKTLEWLDKIIKEAEADEQKLEQGRFEARKRMGVYAWNHRYTKVVFLAKNEKQVPKDVPCGVLLLRKSGTQVTAYYKKYQTVFSEMREVKEIRPDILKNFSKIRQEKSGNKYVSEVASLFGCFSHEYYAKKKVAEKVKVAKQAQASLGNSHRRLAVPLEDLRLLHSYTEQPKLIAAPKQKEGEEQKTIIIYSPDQVPARAPKSFADGLQLLREKRLKKAIAAAPSPQLATPQAVAGAEIKFEKAPVKKLSFFSAAVSASPASVPQASASRPAPKAESKRGKLLLSPGVAPMPPTAAGRPGSPRH